MNTSKADIIAQLKKEILPLQGYKPIGGNQMFSGGLGPINRAFPNGVFPLAAIHEFICNSEEEVSASAGFVTGILSALMHENGIIIWICPSQTIFPPALKTFGIEPDKVVFICLQKEKDLLWTMEEALKCEGLAAVVAEIADLSFTASRRFQLAVEKSRVTGFVIRRSPRNLTSVSIARWRISPLPALVEDNLPGVGFPRWNVELLKVRNGTPGIWELEWAGKFRHVSKLAAITTEQQRKAG